MKRLITIAAVALTLGLAASPAASAAVAGGKSGTEYIQGSTTLLSVIDSNAAVVPLKAHGVVDTYGHINLGGATNGRSTLYFHAGNLRVKHTKTSGGSQPSFNPKTCVASLVEGGLYTVVRGTGKFYGAQGHGKYQVDFTVKFARLKNGKCNTSPSAEPISGKISFRASGPLSVR
jgi:hypothetical protein